MKKEYNNFEEMIEDYYPNYNEIKNRKGRKVE